MADSPLLVQFQPSGVAVLQAPNGRAGRGGSAGGLFVEMETPLLAPDWDAAAVGEGLREALAKRDGGGGYAGAILVLHRADYAVALVTLPIGTDEETNGMLRLEMAERTPLDEDEICLGWERLESDDPHEQRLQVFWTPRRRLEAMLQALEAAGLETLSAQPGAALYRKALHGGPSPAPDELVLKTPGGCETFQWDEDGRLASSRGGPATVGPVDAGTVSPDSRFPAAAAESLDEEQRRSGRFTGLALALGASPAVTPRRRAGADPSAKALDMLPHSIHGRRESARRRGLLIQAAVLTAAILALAGGNLWYYVHRMEQQLESRRAEVKQLVPLVQEVEVMEDRLRSIRQQIDYVIAPLETLHGLNRVLALPQMDGLFLDGLRYAADGRIGLEGHVTNDITPWQFTEALNATGVFRVVQPPRIETRRYGEARSTRFSLSIESAQSAGGGNGDEAI